jgi:NAD(P)-dependent dehydrogenase (short-subunit alcohol dehydrogenase family)
MTGPRGERSNAEGKLAVVTGATGGIGLKTAVALGRLGARVVLVGRDPARLEAALVQVRAAGGPEPAAFTCDFASQQAIRAFAARFLESHERLDVLVNNAGGVHKKRTVTVDGIETTFAVNHLGYFLTTNLLLPALERAPRARVVSVSSIAHYKATLDFDDLGFERGYSILRAYRRSKLANVLFAAELARRVADRGITSNSIHPGPVETNIWMGAPAWIRPLVRLYLSRVMIDADKGAAPVVRLASADDVAGVTGRYFSRYRDVPPAPLAEDPAVATRLWDASARLVGLV